MDTEPSPGRPRVSAEERSRLVSLYRASGLTQAEFARRQGLKLATLQQWIYRSGSKKKKKIPARFREFPASAILAQPWLAEVALDSGMTLRISAAAQPDWISAVISALRSKPC
jgi:transposase-like protein